MNAFSNSSTDLIEENAGSSDSDTNPDDMPEYYQPISAIDNDENEHQEDKDSDDQINSDEEHHNHILSNGYSDQAYNGISSLHINDDSAEEEEERVREASDMEIQRAFREDENRRNAPLTAENAVRVMEAMRGVSFTGLAPDWVNAVPKDRWIDQLRRLRDPQRTSSTVQN